MTFEQDPARWTASPDEAPELLRSAFSAARNEGPSQNQMRSLALKVAAVSAGGAVAMGAAKGASTLQAAASAATWSVGKIAGIVALAGGIATTAVIWQQSSSQPKTVPARPIPAQTERAPVPREERADEPAVQVPPAANPPSPVAGQTTNAAQDSASAVQEKANDTSLRRSASRATSEASPSVAAPNSATSPASAEKSNSGTGTAQASTRDVGSASRERSSAKRGSALTIVAAPNETRTLSEIELLRQAKNALRSRPREAYQLTEQHRQQYPGGEFAQERDALAIQALIGAGDTEMARDLAVAFIKAHPTSPHAHRFREAMGIR